MSLEVSASKPQMWCIRVRCALDVQGRKLKIVEDGGVLEMETCFS